MRRAHRAARALQLELASTVAEVGELCVAVDNLLDMLACVRRDSERVDAQTMERRRAARELHDELAQRLTAIESRLQMLAEQVPRDVRSRVLKLQAAARVGIEDVSEMGQTADLGAR